MDSEVQGEQAGWLQGLIRVRGWREDKQWVLFNFYMLILDKDIQLGILGNKYVLERYLSVPTEKECICTLNPQGKMNNMRNIKSKH